MAYAGKCPTCRYDTAIYDDSAPFRCASPHCPDYGLAIPKETAVTLRIPAQAKMPPRAEAVAAIPLRCRGVSRVKDEPRELNLFFQREPTDDEIRVIHDMLAKIEVK